MKKGFTLVELLAVIVILAIIVAIAIPNVVSVVDNSTKEAFKSDAKMVLDAVRIKLIADPTSNPTSIDENNVEAVLNISDTNYQDLTIQTNNGTNYIKIVGQGKWNGYSACGSFFNINVIKGICNNDFNAPVITMLGSSPITADIGSSYTDAGATASDDIDGDITGKITVTGTVNTSTTGTYTLTYNVSDNVGHAATSVTRTVYVFEYHYNYSYTGSSQTFTTPHTGIYKLEAWGASGGADGSVSYGGMGGYSTGQLSLTSGQTAYIYVGSQGASGNSGGGGGYNGGGNAGGSGSSGAGGGASDIRTGGWALANRIIVAGGGGGAGNGGSNYSGYGGGSTGGNGYNSTTNGATQANGGTSTNGNGALGQGASHSNDGGGGGGGYYGGGAGNGDSNGGGGSAYLGSLTSASTIAGNASMPSTSGGTETGHNGNGYVRITYIEP